MPLHLPKSLPCDPPLMQVRANGISCNHAKVSSMLAGRHCYRGFLGLRSSRRRLGESVHETIEIRGIFHQKALKIGWSPNFSPLYLPRRRRFDGRCTSATPFCSTAGRHAVSHPWCYSQGNYDAINQFLTGIFFRRSTGRASVLTGMSLSRSRG